MVSLSKDTVVRIVVSLFLCVGLAGPGLAADDEAAKEKEIKALERRVEELERRADDDSTPPVASAEGGPAPGEEDATGTDPRSFGSKFMPYYRFVELESNVEVNVLALFGMLRFDDSVAMTYELPIMKEIDYSQVEAFKAGSGGRLPPDPNGDLPSGGIPIPDLDPDGDEIGIGDLGLRLFYKNEALRASSPFRENGSSELLLGLETTVPTASEDVLGGKAWILSPFFAVVIDMPLHGFFAAMNFFDFSPVRDNSRNNTGRWRGRWFYMQPLTPPDLGPILGGWYLLPEFQPVYDWENTNFSFWVGPELGKMLKPGRIVYVKPGFGVDPDDEERDWTFEVGFRWFFD
jgi:hypothetical protein